MLLAASNFLVPNATFFVELVAFLIVVGILGKYVLPVINRVTTERQQTIKQSLADAETAKRKAEEAEVEYKRILDEARTEARGLVEEANKAGERARAERRERAEQEYQRIIDRATSDIDASARRAAEDLRRDVSGLVVTAVERVIGQELDDERHRQLIDRTIGEVEAEAASAPEMNA